MTARPKQLRMDGTPVPLFAAGDLKVTHFNDCAMAAWKITVAAQTLGHQFGYVPENYLRPANNFERSPMGLVRGAPYFARHLRFAARTDVWHAHFATVAQLLRMPWMPKRPYLLTLHGTDIRELWKAPATRDLIQRAIDGADHVFYANLDTRENAEAARADAEFLPITVNPVLPNWQPKLGDVPRVLFTSRWDDSKQAQQTLALAAELRRAFPGVHFEALDQGTRKEAARKLGIHLVSPMPNAQFVQWLSGADVLLGQSAATLATTELEGMGTGAPLIRCGDPLAVKAPILEATTIAEATDMLRTALADPVALSTKLDAKTWVHTNHNPELQVPHLLNLYRRAAGNTTR